jgi:hypothetical protein
LLWCLQHVFFLCWQIQKVKTEPEEVEDKEFKEALVPSRLRVDHSMLYCPP